MTGMKKTLIVAFALATMVMGCRPDPFEPIGEPLDIKEGFLGDWKVVSVTQIDEVKLAAEESNATRDLTNLFNFYEYAITFATDGSYTISPGKAPNFAGTTSGTWSFDNPDFPTVVLLSEDSGTTTAAKFNLTRTPQKNINLQLTFRRYKDSKLVLSYSYVFEPAAK